MLTQFTRLIVAACLCFSVLIGGAPEGQAAKTCPTGFVLKKVKLNKKGKSAAGYFKSTENTKCVKLKKVVDPVISSEKGSFKVTTSDPRRVCLLRGVSEEERKGAFLIIGRKRWVECPRGPVRPVTPSLDLDALARSLVVRLRLPDATPIFGPDPNNNEWKMLAVGFPVWLTTAGPRYRATRVSSDGLTFRLSARLTSTTFNLGDGSRVTCTAMTPFTASSKAGSASPTCGHVYAKPSLPKGSYTVTATANWTVNWSVDGMSGSFPMSYSDSAQLPIGELQALNR